MKNLLLLLFITFSVSLMSQKYFYLEEIRLKKKTDFIENEKNVIKATNYLLKSPISTKNFDRTACIRFLLNFATKTPNATLTVNEYVGDLYEKNDELLGMFLGIWLMETILEKDESDEYYQQKTLEKIYLYAKEGNGVKKTKFIKNLIAAGDDEDIETFLKKLLKS